MSKLNIGIAGVGGRMGVMILKDILGREATTVASGLVRTGSNLVGSDLGTLASIEPLGVAITDNPKTCFADADVVVDFSLPEAIEELAEAAIDEKKPWVVGTTGLSEKEEAILRAASEKIPVVFASNMSLGVNLLFALVEQVARSLDDNFDIEILDFHHKHKVDAPSGTALTLGEAAAMGRGIDFKTSATLSREGVVGARTKGEIGFSALRGGAVVGEHAVIFASTGERLELHHKASDRSIYAAGAVTAGLWVRDKSPGMYSMKDVLGINS